ncbi:MAG: glycoside hydrolase family 55 protein [Planctomycetes bacterium]|nr:glycoside hydrolase family 55 protein [Planctomycetota bacterium]
MRFTGILALTMAMAGAGVPSRGESPEASHPDAETVLAETGVINVKSPPYNAAGNGMTDDTEAIQAAWDAAKRTGARVVLPPGEYRISLRGDAAEGYRPALHFSASGVSKEKQPMLEGATRSVTLLIDFPENAPRTQEVIRIDKGTLTDNPRGMEFCNLRLINTTAPRSGTWQDPVDYRGAGIRIINGWTGHLLQNFQVSGFYIGIDLQNGYHSEISHGEIRNCNFGLRLFGTPNGTTIREIALQQIRPVANNTEGLKAKMFPKERIGACVYAGGGTITSGYFESVNTELCSVAGYFFHSAPVSFTVASMRSESVYAPIWIYGPLAPYHSSGCTFITPSIDCDSLIAPAIYLNRAHGYTFINPRFYQRNNEGGSQVAIEMTSGSRGNYILNPLDDGSGTTGNLADDVIDAGQKNEVKWLGADSG